MKLAVVIGHNAVRQGATRRDTDESEYSWNGRLSTVLLRQAKGTPLDVRVFRRTYHDEQRGGYPAEIRDVYNRVNEWGARASIELHFNASENPSATGIETLSSGSSRSLVLAAHVQAEMVAALGLRSRGVKVRTRDGATASQRRGWRSLHYGDAPAVLVEPFFATSAAGLAATDDRCEMEALSAAYLDGAVRALETWR